MCEMQACRFLIELFIGVVAVEAVTEIIISSQFFFGFRSWIYKKGSDKFLINGNYIEIDDLKEDDNYTIEPPNWTYRWLANLFSCGYCFSVWVALVFVMLHKLIYPVAAFVAIIFCVHRLSNLFHVGISKLDKDELGDDDDDAE